MPYVWSNTIATGTAITASAAIEIRTNLSAELTARSTSYAWQYVTAITSGAYVYANDVKEFRTAADLASASTVTCSSENASKYTTVDATADATVNGSNNSGVNSSEYSSANNPVNSTINSTANSPVNSTQNSAADGVL
jgi:hypothetical protein